MGANEKNFDLDPEHGTGKYTCPHCGRYFPVSYRRSRPSWKKDWGIKQYLRLAARSNFRKHVKACSKEEVKMGLDRCDNCGSKIISAELCAACDKDTCLYCSDICDVCEQQFHQYKPECRGVPARDELSVCSKCRPKGKH